MLAEYTKPIMVENKIAKECAMIDGKHSKPTPRWVLNPSGDGVMDFNLS